MPTCATGGSTAAGVLRCVAVCCGVIQCDAVRCSVLQCVAVCCSVLQCVAELFICACVVYVPTREIGGSTTCCLCYTCCSELQCVAVC